MPAAMQPLLPVLGGLLLLYFLFRVFQGVVSKTVAIPVGIAAGLFLTSLGVHPGVSLVAGFFVFWIVARVILVSIRWAVTIACIVGIGALVYAVYTGQIALGAG